ncbi:MAG: VOC family protein [Vicinamibacterales bacterium]
MATRQPARTRRNPAPRKTASTRPKARRTATKRTPAKTGGAGSSDLGSGLAPGMQAISTYLAVANVTATMEFLERAFGFSRGVVLPDADGQIRYAEMRHRESVVILVRKGDSATASGGAAALYTYVADVDLVLGRAREAGAGVAEAEDKPWGDRVASVTDPDGYRWMLATFKKLVPFS